MKPYFGMLLMSAIILQTLPANECGFETGPKSLNEIRQIRKYLEQRLHPKAVPAKDLAPEIKRLSKLYKVNSRTVASILVRESKGLEMAINHKSQDFGIMQINHRHKLEASCVFSWRCNLEAGVRILSTFDRTCRYNVGTGKLVGKLLKTCLAYEAKLMEGI